MSRNIDDVFSDFFGKSKKQEHDKHQAPVKRITPTPAKAADSAEMLRQMSDADRKIGEHMQQQLDELRRMTSEMDLSRIEREVEQDFGVTAKSTGGEPKKRVGIEGFDELLPELTAKLFGQDNFLQRLLIAFKRPYVVGFEPDGVRNAVLLHGKRASGKHTAVYALCELLHDRGVLETADVRIVDLAVYPSQSEERLFLQDLYMALNAKGEVVVFNNFDQCHPAFLTQLADLVIHGRLRLSTRYVLQNGRLIDAGTALTPDAVGTISAGGKYLVFITEKGPASLASSFGAAFVSALSDICETQSFSPESLDKIARERMKAVIVQCAERLDFELECDDSVFTFAASKYTADDGVQGIIRCTGDIFRALAGYKLENDTKKATVHLSLADEKLMADIDGNTLELFSLLPGGYSGELDEVRNEIDKIVGLTEIKKYILSLEDHYKVQKMRKDEGMKSAPLSMHMIFTGNPGTGKTTIARMVSKYLKAIGVLSGGQLIEVTRADLVGKYVGHTAPLTTQVIKSAIGGVLFIDEAYSLFRGEQDSFGLEAIDTLVKGIEDNRDNLIVILAGYSREMAEFMTANSGLRSRFPNIVEFPDYTGEQLREIANIQAQSKGYIVEDDAQSALLDYFSVIQAMDSRESGNGRLARNVIEKAILDQSRRIVKAHDKLNILRKQDFDLFEEQ